MSRPIIGITTSYKDPEVSAYQLGSGYTRSVELAGGLPVMLPFDSEDDLIPRFIEHLDGLLLSGGDDLDPALWGETWHPKVKPCNPRRQRFELALLAEAEKRGLPVLGICLGAQVMNVHRGGSLIQYLPEHPREGAIAHRGEGLPWPTHPVQLRRDSLLGETIGSGQITANTAHKQAVRRLGRGLEAVAAAPDGVIEAVEDRASLLYLGVQWHPERLHDQDEHLALFRLLVERADTYSRGGAVAVAAAL